MLLDFPTKLEERTRHAPVLRRIAVFEGSFVESEVTLSSIVAVEFLYPKFNFWLGHGWLVTFPSVHVLLVHSS